jgi:LacI family transcriptional regulator
MTLHVAVQIDRQASYGKGVLEGIGRYAAAHGGWAFFGEPLHAVPPIPDLSEWDGDGMIAQDLPPELVKPVLARKIPAVNVGRPRPDVPIPGVHSHDIRVGEIGAEHFLERGYRNLAYCGYQNRDYSSQRQEGFCRRLEKDGIAPTIFIRRSPFESRWQWQREHDLLKQWLSELPRPLGIMACVDSRAMHVIHAAKDLGLSVPEDVSVLGVDDEQPLCSMFAPSLSSVKLGTEKIGFEAASLLERLVRGRKTPRHAQLVEPIGIVTRRSTDILVLQDPVVLRAVRYIREHACEGLTVENILDVLGVSRRSLERKFLREIQRTPHDEIRRVQLERARSLLSETDLPMNEVAERIGLHESKHLSVIFRQCLRMTPTQYRQQHQHR